VPALEEWAAATGSHQITEARDADLVLVVGSTDSSDCQRLVEVARRAGTPAHLVDDVGQIDLRWLADARRIAINAGASAPPSLVEEVSHALSGLGLDHRARPKEVS
jgi:4-hydroxy-3-methylbut-2-enyl diphosphate reductase